MGVLIGQREFLESEINKIIFVDHSGVAFDLMPQHGLPGPCGALRAVCGGRGRAGGLCGGRAGVEAAGGSSEERV